MKQTIFVSSVQKELAEERRAIRDFVRNDPLLRQFFDVFLFEDIPASDRRADDVYLSQVDRCGLYVGLYGMEYGLEDREGCSPTEREFDRATEKNRPRLIYVKGADDKGRHPKMTALIRKAGSQLIRRRFSGIQDLIASVYASLVECLQLTGDIRIKPFDAVACPAAKLSDLSREKLDEFLAVAKTERGYALGPKTPLRKALAHLNLLDGENPSHAAILLFGKQPQRFLITSEIKCMHFHGLEVRKPIPSYHIYKGTVFELVDQALDFVMSKINRAVIPRDGKVTSDVEYELPWKAVREAIVNAVTHRDYTSKASVQVMLFADRLEVWNPGELPLPLTLDSLRKPHASIPHNPLIADPMFLATYAEKAGSGILDMMQLSRQAGLRPPAFREDAGQFVQTIWRPKPVNGAQGGEQVGVQVSGQVNVLRKSVLCDLAHAMGMDGEQVDAQDFEQVITMLITCRTRPSNKIELLGAAHLSSAYLNYKRHVAPLLESGLIEMTIPTKPTSRNQKYRITEKGRQFLTTLHNS